MPTRFRIGLIVALVLVGPALGLSAQTRGEVSWVDGDTIVVSVRSGPTPAVGDRVSVSRPLDAGGNAVAIGHWTVTDVQGTSVRAVRKGGIGEAPRVGMVATIGPPHGDELRPGPDVPVPGSPSSGVPGAVTSVRGQDITLRVLGDAAVAAVGDRVELSFAVGEDTIVVGTWRVTAVRADGLVDAAPVEVLATPTSVMKATVWATGSRADAIFQQASGLRGKDPARAVELFLQAAAAGHAEAAEQAGFAFMEGRGVPRDDARAAALFRQAAEAGRPKAQNAYGAFLTTGRGGLAKDPQAGAVWYRKAVAQGEPQACSNLCGLLLEGLGVEKDEAEALRLCLLAAAQDRSDALDRLGWMHQYGLGVQKDLAKAFKYYERAARLGDANGQNNLGTMYENGWGVSRDLEQALAWFRQSAAQGYPWAEWNLGRMYQEGLGVPRDEATAIEHFRRAARGGHQAAQEKLRQLGQTW
ncbi:MAG: sel1 repeat family protein [Thermoanaerobaculaceae bacterium]|jgi:TPR repeat protein|nr:sel1 repeat family protein [Thermoanaerobaculaceae bacterium]